MAQRGSCTATCLDCGERERLPWKDFARASRPRCRACGGLLQPSEQKRRLAARGRDRFNADREGR